MGCGVWLRKSLDIKGTTQAGRAIAMPLITRGRFGAGSSGRSCWRICGFIAIRKRRYDFWSRWEFRCICTGLGRWARFLRATRRLRSTGRSRRLGPWEKCCGRRGRFRIIRIVELGRLLFVKLDQDFAAVESAREEEIDTRAVGAGASLRVDWFDGELFL